MKVTADSFWTCHVDNTTQDPARSDGLFCCTHSLLRRDYISLPNPEADSEL